jgi:hypothetical protein
MSLDQSENATSYYPITDRGATAESDKSSIDSSSCIDPNVFLLTATFVVKASILKEKKRVMMAADIVGHHAFRFKTVPLRSLST